VGDIYLYSNQNFMTVTPTPSNTPTPTATIPPTATLMPTVTPPPSNGYDYNRAAAVAYADAWAHWRNPLYPFWYETGCYCNDCTNYISQVLHHGGLSLRPGTYNNDISEWWYGPLDSSFTWSVTDWLYDYTRLYRTEFDTSVAVGDLEGGDFILVDAINNNTGSPIPDGKPDHGRVVVGYGDTSIDPADYECIPEEEIPTEVEHNILLVNQHCTDRKHVAWDFRIEDVPQFFVHVTK
jgi:hypothetical protein